MDDTTVTPCTSVIAIDNVQQLKVGCNFLAACAACNCVTSCYLVGLSDMANAYAHYNCKSTPQHQHSADVRKSSS